MKRWLGIALVAAACGPHDASLSGEPVGAVSLAAVGTAHDVAHVAFTLVEAGGDCTSGPVVASETVALHPLDLDGHRFGETSFVVAAGSYLACASPLQGDMTPSAACAPASALTSVVNGQTSQVALVSQCASENGGVDLSLALNEAPAIDGAAVSPSKFIEDCEEASLSVSATDPESDALSYSWAVTAQPVGATPALTPAASTATFGADLAGDYEITVLVSDVHGAGNSIAIPMHVSDGDCLGAGHVAWMIAGGAGSADEMTAVAVAPDGHIFATAAFRGTVDFGGGPLTATAADGVLLKVTPAGAIVWQTHLIGQNGNEYPRALAVDTFGDVLIGGDFTHRIDLGCGEHIGLGVTDTFVGKLDGQSGACLWSYALGGTSNDFLTALAVDPAGNVVLGGRFGSPDFSIPGGSVFASHGGFDIFYASFDENGVHRWDHQAGGTGVDQLFDIDIDAAGTIALAGSITSFTVTFDPGVTSPSTVDEDLFVALASGGTGNVTQLLVPQATGSDRARSVAFDPIGDLVVGFELGGTVDLGGGPITAPATSDVVVARLHGEDLRLDWAFQANAGTWGEVHRVAVDAEGDVRLTGDFHSSLAFGATLLATTTPDDFYVACLRGIDGSPQWAIAGGSAAGDDEAMPGLAIDAGGAAYVAGRFGNDAQPGFVLGDSAPVASQGNYDAFLARVDD